MASLLSPEQAEIYIWTADVYAPGASVTTPSGGRTDPDWNQTPVAEGVPVYKESKPNSDDPSIVGRGDIDMVFTLDVFHFPILWDDAEPALSLGAGYLIKFHAAGHPDGGLCYLTQGEIEAKSLMANKQKVNARTTPSPKFLL